MVNLNFFFLNQLEKHAIGEYSSLLQVRNHCIGEEDGDFNLDVFLLDIFQEHWKGPKWIITGSNMKLLKQ